MRKINFANVSDFEDYAREWLDRPTYEHLKGKPRPAEHFENFAQIKLRLRGLLNMNDFKGINSVVLNKPVASPIAFGPLPQIADIQMVSTINDNPSSLV